MSNEKISSQRAGCYVRVSTENQLENYSIEAQTERLKAYCKAKDLSVYKIYTDPGYSGGTIHRPALNQMLCDIRKNLFDIVVVYKLDRLSRSQKDTLLLIEDEFLKHNVDFISVNENFDTSTPFGRAMIGILSVFAQLEKDQITERFTMGRIGRSKAGYYHGGPNPPTGYDYIDGKLIINPYKAAQVKEIYERFTNGYSINSIAEYMHNRYGGWNSHTLVLNILKNSVYIGKVKFKKQEYDGIHMPIISKDMFEKTQHLLNIRTENTKMHSVQKTPFRASNLLTGFLFCANCGAKYSTSHGYYKCYSRSKNNPKFIADPSCKNMNWPIDALDQLVIHEICKLRCNDEYINSRLLAQQPVYQIDSGSAELKLKEIDNRISKIINLYQLDTIPIEDAASRIHPLQTEKKLLCEKLTQMQADTDLSSVASVDYAHIFENIFTNASLAEKRLFIRSLIEHILIDENQIQIKWKL